MWPPLHYGRQCDCSQVLSPLLHVPKGVPSAKLDPQSLHPWCCLTMQKYPQAEYKLGLRLKRDVAAFFGEWQRRAAWQAHCQRVLGTAVARLINRTLALAVQHWRERTQWQVLRAAILCNDSCPLPSPDTQLQSRRVIRISCKHLMQVST